MEEKWNEIFARTERILIRAALLILLAAGLAKLIVPELRDAYNKLVSPQETYRVAPEQPKVRLTGATE